jgi:transcriptional regulator with XRE-family HTH domain
MLPDVSSSVGQNIKRLREAKGYKTQGEFAAALEVPQPRVSDWENDRYDLPDTASLLKIAKKLKVSIDELLTGVDNDYDAVRRDLPDHGRLGSSALPGGPDDSAQARLLEAIESRDAYIKALQDVLAIAGNALAQRRQSGRRKGASAGEVEPTPRRRAGGSR